MTQRVHRAQLGADLPELAGVDHVPELVQGDEQRLHDLVRFRRPSVGLRNEMGRQEHVGRQPMVIRTGAAELARLDVRRAEVVPFAVAVAGLLQVRRLRGDLKVSVGHSRRHLADTARREFPGSAVDARLPLNQGDDLGVLGDAEDDDPAEVPDDRGVVLDAPAGLELVVQRLTKKWELRAEFGLTDDRPALELRIRCDSVETIDCAHVFILPLEGGCTT